MVGWVSGLVGSQGLGLDGQMVSVHKLVVVNTKTVSQQKRVVRRTGKGQKSSQTPPL